MKTSTAKFFRLAVVAAFPVMTMAHSQPGDLHTETADLCAPTATAPATRPAALQQSTHRVLGLFSPDREADLRVALEGIPTVQFVRTDLDFARVTFAYDPATAFPGTKPDKIAERFDQLLRQASNGTFSIKPATTTPREKLQRVEIAVAALDCKACSLAAHEMLLKIDGVEQALVSFKEGRITVRFDMEKTSKEKMEAVLKEKGVTVGP